MRHHLKSRKKMGLKCKGTSARGCMVRFVLMALFAICSDAKVSSVLGSDMESLGLSESKFIIQKHGRRKLDDIGGSINIDCGIPDESSYDDPSTHLQYVSDRGFINAGVNKNISPNCSSTALPMSLMNLRSFPQGNRSCYTLRPPEGKATIYLIRASFMYGNYDNQDKLPQFDLYVGVNLWDSVKFDNASHIVIKEIIHVPEMDNIYVCLLNTGSGTPFLSALELRHFHNSTYTTKPRSSLVLYQRLDFGSTTNQIVRFKDDVYDRIWLPYNCPLCTSLKTSFIIDSLKATDFNLPSMVMQSAARPMNESDPLNFEFDIGDPSLHFAIYMHFAELERLQENQYRELDITLNGNLLKEGIVLNYLQSTTIPSPQSVKGAKLSFSVHKSASSTLPPILNAIEIYVVRDSLHAPTVREDVDAIEDIKSSYGIGRDWQGDPCAPEPYSWEGLDCSYSGYDPPRITSLKLSSSGLTGQISPSFSNLKFLQHLDLSNNSLTGSLPEFLSQLPNLSTLNLLGNKLSGSVPSVLTERSNNGSLLLSLDGSLELCLLPPCKKEKKGIVVLIVVPLVVIIIALIILWIYKRGKVSLLFVNPQKEEGSSLKSDNRQFTYAEIARITNNFSTVIGKGGFGTVYHGCLTDGMQVAVKMISPSSIHGSIQFRNEAQLLMRVHHRNLASFVGYCNEGTNNGIIYEYMACGNLEQYLLDKSTDVLSWKERLQIALDAAQGLEYLHHGCKPPIIHRDVKSANILLSENLQAKIADFGFSKLFPIESRSHLSTVVVGTVGYLDPEYYSSNRLTEKSDVYSFGVVLLELITGRPAIIKKNDDSVHIVPWVIPVLESGDIRSAIDPRLQGNFGSNSVWKFMEIAMSCVPSISIQRPNMSDIVIELKECLETEIAFEQARKVEGRRRRASSSFEMSAVDPETEIGPEAR